MRLFIRVPTTMGPRTVVVQGLSRQDADLLACAMLVHGGDTRVLEDVPAVPYRPPTKLAIISRLK